MTKTIELIKSEIYEAKSNLLNFTQLLKEEPKREGYSFYVTYFTNRLKTLEQIKCVLEAWEVVKEYTDTSEDTVNTEYYFIKGIDDEFETLKKALEVEDE